MERVKGWCFRIRVAGDGRGVDVSGGGFGVIMCDNLIKGQVMI